MRGRAVLHARSFDPARWVYELLRGAVGAVLQLDSVRVAVRTRTPAAVRQLACRKRTVSTV
jgi:hypothetical protein